ncbi:hypothetical protein H4Q26_005395 [Puccinia striiformis f. sp. tritici PST-130]|nr:hypothetical protein H4Q26_005395 [Puccinia striiformis f. sp. tritici PST-130]
MPRMKRNVTQIEGGSEEMRSALRLNYDGPHTLFGNERPAQRRRTARTRSANANI